MASISSILALALVSTFSSFLIVIRDLAIRRQWILSKLHSISSVVATKKYFHRLAVEVA